MTTRQDTTSSSTSPSPAVRPTVPLEPLIAGLAVVLASTALSGVISGTRWLVAATLAALVVVAAGMGLRATPLPIPLRVVGQIGALLCLLTLLFTEHGVLGVLPGPGALEALGQELGRAVSEIRVGIPPVQASRAIQCLVALTIGLVAVLVDLVAVTAATPAAAGLILLCVFAVPASLADELLPWWTFALGAVGFTLLLLVDNHFRYRRWLGARARAGQASTVPAAATMGGLALVVALVVGSSLTFVGTAGRLPGAGDGLGPGGAAGIGNQPFTSLRGQLHRGSVVELFRVRGLERPVYLRALTLRHFDPQVGWTLDELPAGVPASGPLPPPPGGRVPEGERIRVEIEPVGFQDNWLPVYGVPLELSGTGPEWRYAAEVGAVFAPGGPRRPGRYVEEAVLPTPTVEQLRAAPPGASYVDPAYLAVDGLDPRVAQLAQDLTAEATTDFDKARALNHYFTRPENGFRYSLETEGTGSGDALVDFLFHGKAGFCQQYASAMAVMLRAVGVPARVAIGYTSGFDSGEYRVITTEDAHAWVEAFFPGIGWLTFDPTPLADGRGIVPTYVSENPGSVGEGSSSSDREDVPGGSGPTPSPASRTSSPTGGTAIQSPGEGGHGGGFPVWLRWLGGVVLVIAVVLVAPAAVREAQRRRRLRLVSSGQPGAATAAWQELLAEAWDRGIEADRAETVRATARRLAREYDLDEDGRNGLRVLLAAVEREWYGPEQDGEEDRARRRELVGAVAAVRDSLARQAPLSLRARLLPRSVFRSPVRSGTSPVGSGERRP